jgi:hypothetical protein
MASLAVTPSRTPLWFTAEQLRKPSDHAIRKQTTAKPADETKPMSDQPLPLNPRAGTNLISTWDHVPWLRQHVKAIDRFYDSSSSPAQCRTCILHTNSAGT